MYYKVTDEPDLVRDSNSKAILNVNNEALNKYKREKEIGKILSGEFLGIKFTQDTSAYRNKILKKIQSDFYKGRVRIKNQLKEGNISNEQAKEKLNKLKEKYPNMSLVSAMTLSTREERFLCGPLYACRVKSL